MRWPVRNFLVLAFLTSFSPFSPALEPQVETAFSSREEIPDMYKWNMNLFYSSWEEWEADLKRLEVMYNEMAAYKGRLAEGPETLIGFLGLSDQTGMLSTKVYGYVGQIRDLDTRANGVRARFGELMGLYSRMGPKLSWVDPEILSIPVETMTRWIDAHPRLEPYRFGIMDTYRTGQYTLDERGEMLLSLHRPVRSIAEDIYGSITNADGDRPEVVLSSGESITVTPGTYGRALNVYQEPSDRRAVQEAWMEQFQDRGNTFSSIYNGVMQQGWALAQSRGYETTFQMELDRNNIPMEVVTSLIAAARGGAAELQRYHRLRKTFLGLDDYGWSDMHVSLVPQRADYEYDKIVPLVIEAAAPLGIEYQTKIAEQFSAGFVDVFETPGKRSGAYNTGRYGIGSFVLLNFQGTLDDVFTVAHEMGHSMHTRLSQEYQPYSTHRYTIFVAEVASSLNEKLLLDKLLEAVDEPEERIAMLERQIDKIRSTFFLQTMMADYEIQAHALAEKGEGITADRLTELWKETVKAYHGEVIPESDPYMYSWARIPHLFRSPFYVYQYATCFAASSSMMKQMSEDPRAVERYLQLLKSGGNDYPMRQLQKAGIDLTDASILRAVIEEFGHLVDLLEAEYVQYQDALKGIG